MKPRIYGIALFIVIGIPGCGRETNEIIEQESQKVELDSIGRENHSQPAPTSSSQGNPSIEFPGLSSLDEGDSEFLTESMEKALRKVDYELVSAATESIMNDQPNLGIDEVIRTAPNFESKFGITRVDVGGDVRFMLSLPSTVQIRPNSNELTTAVNEVATKPDGVLTGNRIEMPNLIGLDAPELNRIIKIEELIQSRNQEKLVDELFTYIQEQADLSSMKTFLDPPVKNSPKLNRTGPNKTE